MEHLFHPDILEEVNITYEKELFDFLAKYKMSGYMLKYTSLEMITKRIDNPSAQIQFDIFYERLSNKFKVANISTSVLNLIQNDSEIVETMTLNMISSANNLNELNNMGNAVDLVVDQAQSSNESTSNENSKVSKRNKKQSNKPTYNSWPDVFKFPIDQLPTELEKALRDPNTILTKQQKNHIIRILVDKRKSYNIQYPIYMHYRDAARSLTAEYASIKTHNPKIVDELHDKVKARIQESRRGTAQTQEQIEKRAKYTPKNKEKSISNETNVISSSASTSSNSNDIR